MIVICQFTSRSAKLYRRNNIFWVNSVFCKVFSISQWKYSVSARCIPGPMSALSGCPFLIFVFLILVPNQLKLILSSSLLSLNFKNTKLHKLIPDVRFAPTTYLIQKLLKICWLKSYKMSNKSGLGQEMARKLICFDWSYHFRDIWTFCEIPPCHPKSFSQSLRHTEIFDFVANCLSPRLEIQYLLHVSV